MSTLLACAYALACGWLVWRAISRAKAIDVQLGVMGLFAFGYFPLPVLMKPLTSLAAVDDDKLFPALAIHALFLAALIVSALLFRRTAEGLRPLRFSWLDDLALRHRGVLCAGAFALHLGYVVTTPQTSYDSEDFDAFFEEKSPFRSGLAAISGLCMSFVAMCCATSALWRRTGLMIVCAAMILCAVLLALPLGQRLAALSPLVLLLAAFAATRQARRAMRLLGVSIVVLLMLSPFAVYMRESRRAHNGDFLSAAEVTGGYQISESPIAQGFASVLDRSDIVYNTVYLKDYIDREGYVGWTYYYSVLVSPIPRLVYANKPYVLSADGRLDGEISVLAWKVMIGGLGSLTAFGGLTAYREGGWLGVVLDGLADGAFFVFIARWLGEGGWLARMFYGNFFLAFAVQKAPPCFLEALASFLGMSPLIGAAYALSRAPDLMRIQLPRTNFVNAARKLPGG